MYWKLYFFKIETVWLNQRDLPLKLVCVKYRYKHDRHAVGIPFYWGVGLGWGLIYTFQIGFGFKMLPLHFVEH